jgi:AcrR family transcriptional regulator
VLPPGRPRLSKGEVARNQRERVLYATSEVAFSKGFVATSITEIASAAGLDARVFYSHFPDKLSAFLAAHELGFEHTMAVASGAFFSAAAWPERVWRGVLACTQFQASHPVLTHMLHVQSYATGAAGAERVEDTHSAFTLFLQEGAQLADAAPPPGVSDAIIAACFEIPVYLSRQARGEEISRFAALMTYLCLAPFLGPDEATAFVAGKLRDVRRED